MKCSTLYLESLRESKQSARPPPSSITTLLQCPYIPATSPQAWTTDWRKPMYSLTNQDRNVRLCMWFPISESIISSYRLGHSKIAVECIDPLLLSICTQEAYRLIYFRCPLFRKILQIFSASPSSILVFHRLWAPQFSFQVTLLYL